MAEAVSINLTETHLPYTQRLCLRESALADRLIERIHRRLDASFSVPEMARSWMNEVTGRCRVEGRHSGKG